MPRYVVRRGYHSYEQALADALRSFPDARDLKLTEVPRRPKEFLFEHHYKISFFRSSEKKK